MVENSALRIDTMASTIQVENQSELFRVSWSPTRQSRGRRRPPVSWLESRIGSDGICRVRGHYSYDNKDGSRYENDRAAVEMMEPCPADIRSELGFKAVDGDEVVFAPTAGPTLLSEWLLALAQICDAQGYQQTWIAFSQSYGEALSRAKAAAQR